MQILARPKNTTSKTVFILYINVLEHWNRIKNGLVLKVDFEHPTLQGVSYPLHFPPGRSLGLGAFAPSGRYYIIADNHLNSNPCLI